jgi:hypothetical protein
VDARARRGRDDALRLVAAASKVIVAKGRKLTTFDLKKNPPDEATLLAAMLGPTGNLRAPAVKLVARCWSASKQWHIGICSASSGCRIGAAAIQTRRAFGRPVFLANRKLA